MKHSKVILTGLFACMTSLMISFSAKAERKSNQTDSDNRGIEAVASTEFLNSMGICTSVAKRGEKLEETIESIKYTGLRWVRVGYEDNVPLEEFIRFHKETGAKLSYGLLSGGTNINRILTDAKQLAAVGALLAIEGANEPNNWGVTYKGEKGGAKNSWLPVAKLHRDLYAAVKADPILKDYPVWATCETGAQTDNVGLQFLTIPEGANTLMPSGTQYADFANCHNYVSHPSWKGLHDNQTWIASSPFKDCRMDGLTGNFGLTWLNKFPGYSQEELATLPRVTTETGYAVKEDEGVTEEIQARLYLNLYLSQFKRGWKHTSVYLLKGRANEPAHEKYAFYTLENKPKQAAHYLHNFTTILADDQTIAQTGKYNYSIPNQPETTHDLLLRHSKGEFVLILWGERFASGGADNITVKFRAKCKKIVIYDPTVGTEPLKEYEKVNAIDLALTDHPVIIKIKN